MNRVRMVVLLVSFCGLLQAQLLSAQVLGDAEGPRTAAEASGYQQTSRLQDVDAFLDALKRLPYAGRLQRRVLLTTAEGRELPLVVVAKPQPATGGPVERLRLVCTGNIHAGEVEGKEALQVLLREIALGQHDSLLDELELWIVPVFNGDGNERVDVKHRETQNGPVGGVGTRANARGLDLNRDFVKAESLEVRGLLGLWNEIAPHVFMDLHTTNGSYHGYHLTYAPSLSTNADPGLDSFARQVLFPEVTATLEQQHGFRTHHYGNFGSEDPRSFSTYDHRPRFGTNAFGLRGRLAILSEAYSYLPFQQRVEVTHAFVVQVLSSLAAHRKDLLAACAEADRRVLDGEATFGWDSHLVIGQLEPIAVGAVTEVPLGEGRGVRREATGDISWEDMLVSVAFESRERAALPQAWVVLAQQEQVAELLTAHGIAFERLDEARRAKLMGFEVSAVQRSKRPFQEHREVRIEGAWGAGPEQAPAGALWVPSVQVLGRLAAQLLEPLSEDSAATWNLWDHALGLEVEGQPLRPDAWYPVLRAEALD